MTTLTVEDGSIVSGANTYVSLADVIAYALDRGVDLEDVDEDVVTAMIIKAMDYLSLYSSRWQGSRVGDTQVLDWPRTGVKMRGMSTWFPETAIPNTLKAAVSQLVIEQHVNDVQLLQSTLPGLPVIREKLDVIETEYARPTDLAGEDYTQARMPLVEALLAPLVRVGFGVRTLRV
jgi:hypothetical protein